jgi:hypothetical protein
VTVGAFVADLRSIQLLNDKTPTTREGSEADDIPLFLTATDSVGASCSALSIATLQSITVSGTALTSVDYNVFNYPGDDETLIEISSTYLDDLAVGAYDVDLDFLTNDDGKALSASQKIYIISHSAIIKYASTTEYNISVYRYLWGDSDETGTPGAIITSGEAVTSDDVNGIMITASAISGKRIKGLSITEEYLGYSQVYTTENPLVDNTGFETWDPYGTATISVILEDVPTTLPEIMGIGPVAAIPKALKIARLALNDIGLIELNEAFAAQAVAVIRQLEIDEERVNVNGGAIALGHPLGATGAKLTVQLLHEMKRRQVQFGMVTMCIGGGMGAAGIFERI